MARCARRIVGVIGLVSAVILAGVTTALAQAVLRQPPPSNSLRPASQQPAPGTTSQPAPADPLTLKPVTDAPPVEAAPIITFGATA